MANECAAHIDQALRREPLLNALEEVGQSVNDLAAELPTLRDLAALVAMFPLMTAALLDSERPYLSAEQMARIADQAVQQADHLVDAMSATSDDPQSAQPLVAEKNP